MIEICLCILILAASAALIKMALWFSAKTQNEQHKEVVTDKMPRVIYIFKTSRVFHVEGGCHLKKKLQAATAFTMCEECSKTQ
jgi:flagellar basal body-associated protein FliL